MKNNVLGDNPPAPSGSGSEPPANPEALFFQTSEIPWEELPRLLAEAERACNLADQRLEAVLAEMAKRQPVPPKPRTVKGIAMAPRERPPLVIEDDAPSGSPPVGPLQALIDLTDRHVPPRVYARYVALLESVEEQLAALQRERDEWKREAEEHTKLYVELFEAWRVATKAELDRGSSPSSPTST